MPHHVPIPPVVACDRRFTAPRKASRPNSLRGLRVRMITRLKAAMPPSSRSGLSIILILGALSTVSPFSIDMYLPAFPQIAHDLGTTPAQISLSVSGYFIGLAIGQLFYGPMLDRFGRKRPLYAGLSLFTIASFGCIAGADA